MTGVTIWHNPRCTKSRETLALLQGKGLDITERRYLDDAPTQAELRAALALLETLNDIGASEFLGVQTLTVSIYSTWITRSDLPGAAQIADITCGVRGRARRVKTARCVDGDGGRAGACLRLRRGRDDRAARRVSDCASTTSTVSASEISTGEISCEGSPVI